MSEPQLVTDAQAARLRAALNPMHPDGCNHLLYTRDRLIEALELLRAESIVRYDAAWQDAIALLAELHNTEGETG